VEISYFSDLLDHGSEAIIGLLSIFIGGVVHLVQIGQLLAVFDTWFELF
jgi:hypothetical protein